MKAIQREVKYWNERFKLLEESKQKTVDEYVDQIKRQFDRGIKRIEGELSKFYQRYAKNEGISYSEASKILSGPEKEELKMDVDEYIRLGKLNALDYNEATAKLLERASTAYRVTRLQALKLKLSSIVAGVFTPVAQKAYDALYKVYNDVYNGAAYILMKGRGIINTAFNGASLERIANILRQPWREGVTFSEKIWLNQNKLIQTLTDELSSNILNGSSYDEMARNLSKKMDSSYQDAKRLVSTEAAYFYGEAQKDAMEEMDVKRYQFRSELNTRVCNVCGDLDSMIFKYSERQPGLNAVPMHPNCRCIERPYVEDMEDEDDTRSGRDEEGKSKPFPASMTYKEWYEAVGKKLEEKEKEDAKKKKKKKKGKKKDPKKPSIRIAEVNALE